MRVRPTIFAFALVLLAAPAGFAASEGLYATTQASDDLHFLDSVTGSLISSTTMTLAGDTINGTNGLAVSPTGQFFVVARLASGGTRALLMVDPDTGVATNIGDMGDNFAGIAFDSAGVLYGVTGDGAATSSTLFTVSTANASTSLVTALGNGDDGETIAFNPDDGLLYHLSGLSTQIFESVDTSGAPITPIAMSGPAWNDEVMAFSYAGSGVFWVTERNTDNIRTITTAGARGTIGSTGIGGDNIKGLAFFTAAVPEPSSVALFGLGLLGMVGVIRRRRRQTSAA